MATKPTDEENLEDELEIIDDEEEETSEEAEQDERQPADEDEELDYGGRAQKRIRQLVTQRRELEEKLAASVMAQTALEERVTQVSGQSTASLISKLETDLKSAKEEYATAFDAGDGKALAEVQARMSQLQTYIIGLKASQQNKTRPQRAAPVKLQEPAKTPAAPDKNTKAWMAKNDWFGNDRVMTVAAMQVHADLIQQGYNPTDPADPDFGVDAYYRQIDKRMRTEFPHKFKSDQSTGATPKVARAGAAPANRLPSSNKLPALTNREVALAKKMGIDPKVYAREKQKILAREAR